MKMSIHVRPGDSDPPSVSRNVDGSTLAFSIVEKAAKISSAATFRVFAAVFSRLTLSVTSYNPKSGKTLQKIISESSRTNCPSILRILRRTHKRSLAFETIKREEIITSKPKGKKSKAYSNSL